MIQISLSILICIHLLFLLFHTAVILKWFRYKMIWGGRLKTDQQMYLFESVSIVATSGFTIILLAKAGYLGISLPQQLIEILLWIMAVLYFINTLGNLKSNSWTERIIFAPLTLLMLILLLIILFAPYR